MKVNECLKVLAPKWSAILEEAKNMTEIYHNERADKQGLSISNFESCIVGEARGFQKSAYYNQDSIDYCSSCIAFANQFDAMYVGSVSTKFNYVVENFCEHMKEHQK